jgi:hypothetical protein
MRARLTASIRALLASALLALSIAMLAGCGGSSSTSAADNGVASKSANDIVSASKAAAANASSVHVSGSLVTDGAHVTLDMSLASGKGATGSLSENGLSFKLIMVGDTAYINASPAFYRQLSGEAAAKLLAGKWLKAPANTGEFGQLGQLADMGKLLDTVLSGHGKLTKGATTTIGGQSAIAVTDSTQGGTLYVATTGQPYPLQISKAGSEGGKITFDRWNQPVSIKAPAKSVVDLAKLKALPEH